MGKVFFPFLILIAFLVTNCNKKSASGSTKNDLTGFWVLEGDTPGPGSADTLFFSEKNGKKLLNFYTGPGLGSNLPRWVETEYKFENGKLSYFDYLGSYNKFMDVESFQWLDPGKKFSVKRYQILGFFSADYRVTYIRTN